MVCEVIKHLPFETLLKLDLPIPNLLHDSKAIELGEGQFLNSHMEIELVKHILLNNYSQDKSYQVIVQFWLQKLIEELTSEHIDKESKENKATKWLEVVNFLNANQQVIQDDPLYSEELKQQNMYNAKYLQKRQQVANFQALQNLATEANLVPKLMKYIKSEIKSEFGGKKEYLCTLCALCYLFGLQAIEVSKPSINNCFIKFMIEVVAPVICSQKTDNKSNEDTCKVLIQEI